MYKCKVQLAKRQTIFRVNTRSMTRAIRAAELRAVRHLDSYSKDLDRTNEGEIRTVRKPETKDFQIVVEKEAD